MVDLRDKSDKATRGSQGNIKDSSATSQGYGEVVKTEEKAEYLTLEHQYISEISFMPVYDYNKYLI